jgi:ribosomal 50S subunit-associated protein YjgA (DUF615 family)
MSEQIEKTDRGYDLMLMRLERWLDELAARGPKAMPEVFYEMAKAVGDAGYADRHEPAVDFNHQKGYN